MNLLRKKELHVPLIHLASLACLCAARCPQGTYLDPHKGCLSCRSICHDYSSQECLFYCGTDWWKNPPLNYEPSLKLVNHTETSLPDFVTRGVTLKLPISETTSEVQLRDNRPDDITPTAAAKPDRQRNGKNQNHEKPVVKSKLNPGAIFVILLISVPTIGCAIYVFIGYGCCKDNRKSVTTDGDPEIIPMQSQDIITEQGCFHIIGITFNCRPVTSPIDDA